MTRPPHVAYTILTAAKGWSTGDCCNVNLGIHRILRKESDSTKVAVFWVVTRCSGVAEYHRFGGSWCLHLQVVTPCSSVVGYQRFGGPCCLHLQVLMLCSSVLSTNVSEGLGALLQGEDEGSKVFQNAGIIPQHYTVSRPEDRDLNLHRRVTSSFWYLKC
jgi:hypothetical protein